MRYFSHEKSLAIGICWFVFNISCSLNKYNQVISSTSPQGQIQTSCPVLKGIWISFFCSVLFHPWQSHIVRWRSQKEPIVQRVMNLELIFSLPWVMLVWKSNTLNPAQGSSNSLRKWMMNGLYIYFSCLVFLMGVVQLLNVAKSKSSE